MVIEAIQNLKDRKGSTMASIRKYVGANNDVDIHRYGPLMKKFIKSATEKGVLVNKTESKHGRISVKSICSAIV